MKLSLNAVTVYSLLLLIIIWGCSEKSESKLLGKWQFMSYKVGDINQEKAYNENMQGSSFEFLKDGSLIFDYKRPSMEQQCNGYYKFIDDQRISLDVKGFSMTFNGNWAISITGNELALTGAGHNKGETYKYKRVK